MTKHVRTLVLIVLLAVLAAFIVMPAQIPVATTIAGRDIAFTLNAPRFYLGKYLISFDVPLKQGLDIRGGIQVVLQADMTGIPPEDQETALEAAREVIARRVDLYGVSEPVVQTSQQGDQHRIIVELAGVTNPSEALQLIGETARLDFRLKSQDFPEATQSAQAFLAQFTDVGLTGQQLRRASVQFDPNTGEPVVGLEFNEEGREQFATVTQENTGEILGIFLDGIPIMLPVIQDAILDGQAVVSGQFTPDDAKLLATQLNAGALPIPITVLEQRTIGASLGQQSVQQSVTAGLVGLGMVMVFMIALYGYKGVLADIALILYALFTIAAYKLLGVTLTLPGIAGLILSVGMAVDANILIFERIKEELRRGKPTAIAIELGFGRAWDSIKDANLVTIVTALILINPFNFSFLNASGLVRGFGMTLLVGVLISLFTGVVVTRTLVRLFVKH